MVYIYRNDRDKDGVLPNGVKVLTSPLSLTNAILSKDNVVKANTLLITSKGTASARHRPAPAATFVSKQTSQSRDTVKSALKLNNRAPANWLRDLAGHIDVVVVDEAHNLGATNVDA